MDLHCGWLLHVHNEGLVASNRGALHEELGLAHRFECMGHGCSSQVAVVVKVAMTPYQSWIYTWVKATGTLRLDPAGPLRGSQRRPLAPLNNKCMELRKVCIHCSPASSCLRKIFF